MSNQQSPVQKPRVVQKIYVYRNEPYTDDNGELQIGRFTHETQEIELRKLPGQKTHYKKENFTQSDSPFRDEFPGVILN